MAKRPSRLKIGLHTYPVKYVEHIDSPEGSGGVALGHCHPWNPLAIEVSDAAPDAAEIVLHEMLHAICQDRAVGEVVGDMEEFIVATLACGLLAAFRENKGLLDWLKGES